MNKKYRVLVYQGVYELRDLGTFDYWHEAENAYMRAQYEYCADDNKEDFEINFEVFNFNSRIEEI